MAAGNSFWRFSIIIPLVIFVVIALLIILRFTKVLEYYSYNSNANAPTIAANQIVLTSKLKKPKPFDFIAFRNSTQPGSATWVFRLCGMEGDTVEIRNGDLWVNGRYADSLITLSHNYLVFPKDTLALNTRTYAALPISKDSVLITFPDQEMRGAGIPFQRYIMPQETIDAYIQKMYHQPWNIDHFGPVVVPARSYFLLGDNRSGALDSRYIGFIHERDFIGTALYY